MRIHAHTDRGGLDCPDEIRSTISCCLKATRSERPTPFSMDNRMGRVTVSRRGRCLPKFAFPSLGVNFTLETATHKIEWISGYSGKAFPKRDISTPYCAVPR